MYKLQSINYYVSKIALIEINSKYIITIVYLNFKILKMSQHVNRYQKYLYSNVLFP